MACKALECRARNLGKLSPYEYEGHSAWELNFGEIGIRKFGVYYHAPCARTLWTWFGEEYRTIAPPFRGVIEYDDYGIRRAQLWRLGVDLVPERMWEQTYTPTQDGIEAYLDLYRAHALSLVGSG